MLTLFYFSSQLKGQVMLLEAQLEKQLESISISQSCVEEVEQVIVPQYAATLSLLTRGV